MEKIDDILDEFHYEMYIAEKEMLDKLSNANSVINNSVLTEDAIGIIQESLKDSLLNYMHKIVGGTQNAWNNFKSAIVDKGINNYYSENLQYFKNNFVMKPPEGFSLPNLKEYHAFIANTIIQPYAPSMDNDLTDEKEFLAKQIPEYASDIKKGAKLKDIADKRLFTPAKGTENIGNNYMNEITKFAAIEYKKVSEQLSTNLKNLNSSTKSMENLLKMVAPSNPTTSTGESYSLDDTMSHYFTEDDKATMGSPVMESNEGGNGTDSNTSNKEKENKGFTSANQSGGNGEDDKQKKLDKVAKVYFKACTTVISNQLAITNKMVTNCFKMMHEYVNLQKKDNKEQSKEHQKQKKENNESNNNGSNQVKI